MVQRRSRKTTTRKRTSTTRRRRSKALRFELKQSVVREIWAVIHLALGVFTLLSLQGSFGLVGEMWMDMLRPILGWGIMALPVAFFLASFMLFFSRKVHFPLSRLMGIFFLMVAGLSVLHLYVPMDSLYAEAQAGQYGGYIGFVANFLLQEVAQIGQIGALAVFLMIFLIGVLLAFEISLGSFMAFLKPNIKLVRKPAAKERVNEKAVEVQLEAENEGAIGSELTEEDLQEERFRVMQDEQPVEMVTIKRPLNSEAVESEGSKEAMAQEVTITEGEALTTDISEDEDYVWEPPPLDLLHPSSPDVALDDDVLRENARKIHDKLQQFGIDVEMHEVHVGPTVIQYTLRPNEGIKLSKITGLKNDLALALAAKAVRIEAPIPGKSLVGIEVPNDQRSLVQLRELLESKEFQAIDSPLRLPLGRDVSGKPICADLATMPHLLVAGATGSGKSVGMNAFLLSLLYQNSPRDLRMILVDPKRVELTTYDGIPHLLTPVITDPEKAAIALRWAVQEMNRRYQLCSEYRHRNLNEFNACQDDHEEGRDEPGHNTLPRIVVVIDELADLMMAAGKEVEASICRLAQMARAVGMHLIVATQRPSVDVITGLIKANIPARIAFAVSSSVDSRTILDGIGAEDLLGKGDMLYLPSGMNKPTRVQGVMVASDEIEKFTGHAKVVAPPHYVEDIISPNVAQTRVNGIPESNLAELDDEGLYAAALNVVRESRKASASLLQRRLKIGYARAARLLDNMEENGMIGPVDGAKPRKILMD